MGSLLRPVVPFKLITISGVDLRLAELLAARLCHELAGAVTAIASGVDLLGEPGLETDREALEVVGESVRRVISRLQFYRFAYGFGGDAVGQPPCDLVAGFFASSRIVCDYRDHVAALPPIEQRLACNLLALGAEALARGGQIAIDVEARGLRLEATGEGVSLAREQAAALALRVPVGELTPRTVQGYLTGLLGRAQGWRLVAATAPGRLYITSAPWEG